MLTAQEFAEARLRELREDAKRARREAEATRSVEREGKRGRWEWRVEPGMEGVFGSLLGWLLSSQREVEVETAGSERESTGTFARQEDGEEEPPHPFECFFECWACH